MTIYTLSGDGGFGPDRYITNTRDQRRARRIARRIAGRVTIRARRVSADYVVWEHRGPRWLADLRGVSIQTSGSRLRRRPVA